MNNHKPPFRNPPEPPPMRIGQEGDTIDRHGVRRKADGSMRTLCTETLVNWVMVAAFVASLGSVLVEFLAR